MKNKVNKILLIICFIIIILILSLSMLGSARRLGYLTEFRLNKNISNQNAYSYNFRIKYHSKIFINSDIFKVYFNVPNNVNINGEKIKLTNIQIYEDGSPFGILVSNKKLKYDDVINNINYTLKLKLPIYIILIVALCYFLFNYKLILKFFIQIKGIYKNLFNDNYFLDCNSITLNKIIYLNKFKINNIGSLIFVITVLVLSIFIMSIEIFDTIKGDDWAYTSISTRAFHQMYYFNGVFAKGFWQRGRHMADILGTSAGFLSNIIRSFGVDPFASLKISSSLFTLIFIFIFTLGFSVASYLFSKNKYYKLFFISIYLYVIFLIVTPTKNLYYLNITAYFATIGISFMIFLPMIYYFLYEKEILFFNNRYIHYGLYTFLVYIISFNMEVSSMFISGISFFMSVYLILDAHKNNKKLNPYILYILVLIMLVSIIAVYISSIGNRAQYMITATKLSNIQHFFNRLYLFEKVILFISILYSLYLLIHLLKNKKINKYDYMVFSFLVTSIIGIIGFFIISTERIYPFQVILLLCIIMGLSKLISNKNIMSFFATIIIVFFFAGISIKIMNDYAILAKSPQTDKILYELFVEADKNNFKEIVIEDKDLLNKFRYEDQYDLDIASFFKHRWYPNSISGWMYNNGVTKKYIPIIIKK